MPFTGKLDEGLRRGAIKNGKKEGPWVSYCNTGMKFEPLTGTYRNDVKVSD